MTPTFKQRHSVAGSSEEQAKKALEDAEKRKADAPFPCDPKLAKTIISREHIGVTCIIAAKLGNTSAGFVEHLA
jgi:hypothetical protein